MDIMTIGLIVVCLALLWVIALYRRGIRERRNLTTLLLQTLLSSDTYEAQQTGLKKMVGDIEASDVLLFSISIYNVIARQANLVGGDLLLLVHSRLWEMKQGLAEQSDEVG